MSEDKSLFDKFDNWLDAHPRVLAFFMLFLWELAGVLLGLLLMWSGGQDQLVQLLFLFGGDWDKLLAYTYHFYDVYAWDWQILMDSLFYWNAISLFIFGGGLMCLLMSFQAYSPPKKAD